jgi:hypothetical protein
MGGRDFKFKTHHACVYVFVFCLVYLKTFPVSRNLKDDTVLVGVTSMYEYFILCSLLAMS